MKKQLTPAERKIISRAANGWPSVWSAEEIEAKYLQTRRETKLTDTQLKRLLRAAAGRGGSQQSILMTLGRHDKRISRGDFRAMLRIFR